MNNTLEFLRWLRLETETSDVTNLQLKCREYGVDACLATIMAELDIARRIDGFWFWNAEEPTEDMAKEVRHVTNIYKNYAK